MGLGFRVNGIGTPCSFFRRVALQRLESRYAGFQAPEFDVDHPVLIFLAFIVLSNWRSRLEGLESSA
jgi:hypothetical protein